MNARKNLQKRYGQHLLVDNIVLERIITSALPIVDVIEVGPGAGALTASLLNAGVRSLQAFEIDRRFANDLSQLSRDYSNFTVDFCDAMSINWCERLANIDIVANLPYNIATHLILAWLHFPIWNKAILMVQKEIADRITAPVGSKSYGRLSAIVQRHVHVEYLFSVAPDSFSPPPKVWSSVIKIAPKKDVVWSQMFDNSLRIIFANPRKHIRQILPDKSWDIINIDPKCRPCDLSIKDLEIISQELYRLHNNGS